METEKLTTETELILFQYLFYNHRRHCTTRRHVHDVDGRTPAHIQYICRRTS